MKENFLRLSNKVKNVINRRKIKEIGNALNDTSSVRWYDWLIVLPIIIFCYLSFNHGDMLITSTHGKDLIECIVTGKFWDFYDYTQSTAVYSIVLYLVFAVWSIPVFLVYTISGTPLWGVVDFFAIPYPVLMWYKLLPTLAYFGIAYLIYKILKEIGISNQIAKWSSYLFIASPISIFSQFIFGQYDSLGLFLTVLALYMFIKKKYYAFSICCAFAIAFKLFALFFFVPLIVLAEKRVLHIIKYSAIALSIYVLCARLFSTSVGYQNANSFNNGIMGRLFSTGITTSLGVISLFTVAMMIVCVYAYNKKPTSDSEYYACSIYIPFFVFGALFAFILWHPQWVMFLIPFMVMAYVLNDKTNSAIILHIAMGIGYIGATVMFFVNNVDSSMLGLGIFKEIFGARDIEGIASYFTFDGNLGSAMYYSLFAGSIFITEYLCFPTKDKVNALSDVIDSKKTFSADRIFTMLLPMVVLIFVLPSLINFFSV